MYALGVTACLGLLTGPGLLASPAAADNGVRPVWTDFQPAVSTQYRPPDGGRAYPKPDTKTIIHPRDRLAAERASQEFERRASQPIRRPAGDPRQQPILPSRAPETTPLPSPSPLEQPRP